MVELYLWHSSKYFDIHCQLLGRHGIIGYILIYLFFIFFEKTSSPLKFLNLLYIKQTERSAGGGHDRDSVRKQVIDGLALPNTPPLLVFPEGGLTTGKKGTSSEILL